MSYQMAYHGSVGALDSLDAQTMETWQSYRKQIHLVEKKMGRKR
jgi:hypothetical protein